MKLNNCLFENDLENILRSGAGLTAAPAELQAHVASCPACSERLRLAEGFRALRRETMASAPAFSPGLLWWRAQLRRRNEALARMERPLLAAQILSLAALLAACCGAFSLGWLSLRGMLSAWKTNLFPAFGSVWHWSLIAVVPVLVLLVAALFLDHVLESASEKH